MNRLFALGFALLLVGLFCLAQEPRAQVPLTGAGLGAPASGASCSQATTLLARMDGAQNTSAVTTLICGMVTDGTYSLLDGFYVFATNSQANAELNWAQNSFNLTKTGTVTFSANNGFTGDGSTGYLNTGFTFGSSSGNWGLNSASLGICVLNTSTGAYVDIGAVAGGDYASLIIDDSGTTFMDLNDATFASYASSTPQGSWVGTRNSSSSLTYYSNGSSIATPSSTSTAFPTGSTLTILALGGASITDYSSHQLAYAFFGGALSGTQVTAIYNRLHTYLTAVGASNGC